METGKVKPAEISPSRLDAEYYGQEYRRVAELIGRFHTQTSLERIRSASVPIRRGIDMPVTTAESNAPLLVTIAAFSDPGLTFDGLERVTSEQHKAFRGSQLAAGDLLVAMGGYAGRAAICPQSTPAANIGRHTARVVVDDNKANKYYLWAFIRSRIGTSQFRRAITGSVQAGINLEDLREISLPAPDSQAQLYIGDKVRRAEQMNDAGRRLQQGIAELLAPFHPDNVPNGRAPRVPPAQMADTLNANPYMARFVYAQTIVDLYDSMTIEELSSSVADGPFGSNLTVLDYQNRADAVHPVVRVKNCENGRFDREDLVWIDFTKQSELIRSEVISGDLLAVCGKSKNPDGILSAFDVVGQLFGRDGVIFPACGALWLVRRAVSGSPDTLLLRVMRLELPGPAVCACARDYRQRPQR